jgi:hypothetical protein
MINDRQVVDLIERANEADPVCACGRHTTPVFRDGVVWLECSYLSEPKETRFSRLVAAATAFSHTHARIVEVPFAAESAA